MEDACADILIVGAGVVGLAAAHTLAAHGASVRVLTRDAPGSGASNAAAGILSPTDPEEWRGDLGAFNRRAIARWSQFAPSLQGETGLEAGYELRGEIRVGSADDGGGPFVTAAEDGCRSWTWRFRRLESSALRELEPGLRSSGLVGVHIPGTAAVDTDRLLPALLDACRRRGVRIDVGTAVTDIDLKLRVLRLSGGGALRYSRALLTAGAWSQELLPPGCLRCQVRPMLGESIVVSSPQAPLCDTLVRERGGSIVPRSNGTTWIGTTVRDRGYQPHPSVGSVRAIAERATRLLPAVGEAFLLDARSGLRPVSSDGLPLLGPLDDHLAVAFGHGREGIIQAPMTADLLARGFTEGDWSTIPPALLPRPPAGG